MNGVTFANIKYFKPENNDIIKQDYFNDIYPSVYPFDEKNMMSLSKGKDLGKGGFGSVSEGLIDSQESVVIKTQKLNVHYKNDF